MIYEGKIVNWNCEKGFGFIVSPNGGNDIFIHRNNIKNLRGSPNPNQIIKYEISADKQDRICGVNASLVDNRFFKNSDTFISIIINILFTIILLILVFMKKLDIQILGFYLFINIATYLVYSKDKSASMRGDWRTPENRLHFLSLIGGWGGALIAQQKLRHKSKKQPFRFIFFITLFINLGVLVYIITPNAEIYLKSFIESIIPMILVVLEFMNQIKNSL